MREARRRVRCGAADSCVPLASTVALTVSGLPTGSSTGAGCKTGASNNGLGCSSTFSARSAPAAPAPRTTRRPPRRRRTGTVSGAGVVASAGAGLIVFCCWDSRDSPESFAAPCSSVLGTMLLATCRSHIAFFQSRTVVTPRSHRGRAPFAPIRGQCIQKSRCATADTSLAAATIAERARGSTPSNACGCCRTATLKYDTKNQCAHTAAPTGAIATASGDYASQSSRMDAMRVSSLAATCSSCLWASSGLPAPRLTAGIPS